MSNKLIIIVPAIMILLAVGIFVKVYIFDAPPKEKVGLYAPTNVKIFRSDTAIDIYWEPCKYATETIVIVNMWGYPKYFDDGMMVYEGNGRHGILTDYKRINDTCYFRLWSRDGQGNYSSDYISIKSEK